MKEHEHNPEGTWVGIQEAAAFLGYSPGAVYTMIYRGEDIPHAKKKGRLRFYLPDLHAWMREDMETPKESVAKRLPERVNPLLKKPRVKVGKGRLFS